MDSTIQAAAAAPEGMTAPRRSALGVHPLLIAVCGVCDATYMAIAPFLPQVARERGLSPSLTGVVFSSFMWGGLLFTPLATRISRNTGARLLLTVTVLVQAALTASFAIAPLMHSREAFFAVCFGLRLAQGVVGCIYEVAVSSLIMCSAPPDRVGAVLGMQEAARGVGMMVGPTVGGVLYGLGGFGLPFLGSAGVLVVLGLACILVLDSSKARPPPGEGAVPITIWTVLQIVPIAVTTAMLTALAMALSVLDPILSPHVADRFHLRPSDIGLIFSAATLSYALFAPPMGFLGQRVGNFTVLAVGMAFTALSYLVMGPCPWVPATWLPTSVWLLVVSMVMLGIGASALTTAVPCMLDSAHARGMSTEDVSDVVGGLLSIAWSLGALAGPLYGSVLAERFGFDEATALNAAALLTLTVVGVVLFRCTSARGVAKEGAAGDAAAGARPGTKATGRAAALPAALGEPLLDAVTDCEEGGGEE